MDISINRMQAAGQTGEAGSGGLREGQLLRGKVTKLYPGQLAEIRTGGRVLTAKLEVPLEAGKEQVFQVMRTKPSVQLRVAADLKGPLSKELKLPESPAMEKLLNEVIRRNLPFQREALLKADELMKQSAAPAEKTQSALLRMMTQSLPLTNDTFRAVIAAQDKEPLLPDLARLARLLTAEASGQAPGYPGKQKLADVLESLTRPAAMLEEPSASLTGRQLSESIAKVLAAIGGGLEARLAEGKPVSTESLKPQLIGLLQQEVVPPLVREQSEQVLLKLNGTQLLSGENSQHQHQLLMQLPLVVYGRQLDAMLEWNGRMKPDGKIDADFARIVFYLSLEALGETVVDMNVQNRIISLTLYHDDHDLQQRIAPLAGKLKEGLLTADYRLSQVTVRPFADRTVKMKAEEAGPPVKGVDIRI